MPGSLTGKTYWLVGASEGLGRALARELSAAGARLCLSARNGSRLAELSGELREDTVITTCDIRQTASVEQAFRQLPSIDGLIFNAGTYDPVSATKWDAAAVEAMCDTNFTGAARVLGCAMPHFVEQGHGHIVLIGSLAGYRGLPGAIGYASSKAALMNLAESLRIDLPAPAFNVQMINPGFIETRLTAKNNFDMPHIMTAEAAAREVLRAMENGRFRNDFPRAFARRIRIARHLPDWLYFRLLQSKR